MEDNSRLIASCLSQIDETFLQQKYVMLLHFKQAGEHFALLQRP